VNATDATVTGLAAAPAGGLARRRAIVRAATGPQAGYCAGAGPGSAAVVALGLAAVAVPAGLVPGGGWLSEGLAGIVAFDAAEYAACGVAEANLVRVSSFAGPGMLTWGADLARHPRLAGAPTMVLQRHDGAGVPVWPIEPLLAASRSLLGRFPIWPGSFVPAAYKEVIAPGPCTVGAALAYGLPEDRDRHACLLMEDLIRGGSPASGPPGGGRRPLAGGPGGHPGGTPPGPVSASHLREPIRQAARSVLEIGRQRNIAYAGIYAGAAAVAVPRGYIGCGLCCCPYLLPGPGALPDGAETMTLPEWEAATGPEP
jgi:histidine decarboxylase